MAARPSIPEKPGKQHVIIGILLATVLLGGAGSFIFSGKSAPKRDSRRQEIVTITLPPPPVLPPPPKVEPPPPKDEPPPEDQMIAQEPIPDDEPPPDAAPPDAPPSDVLGTGISGNGPDMGLGRGTGGGNRIGGGRKGGGSKFGWYAAKVQATIADALRGNPATRSASFSMQVRIWADSSGRISRAQLVGSSGNQAVDDAIRNRVLIGLSLPQAPPADMPMPIVMRLTASRSGS